MVKESQGTTIQAVSRALGLLDMVAEQPEHASAQKLASRLGLKLPTAHHLLATLVRAGYLDRDARKYRLGSKIGQLSVALDRDLRPPHSIERAMRWLALETHETAYASRWSNLDVTIVSVAEGDQAVRVTGIAPGLSGHAYARASGKVLLATGPHERLEAYLATGRLEPLRRRAVIDAERLRRELDQVHATGIAIDREEFMEGVCCLAVAVADPIGPPQWALTVTLPAWRFEPKQDDIVKALRKASQMAIRNSPAIDRR